MADDTEVIDQEQKTQEEQDAHAAFNAGFAKATGTEPASEEHAGEETGTQTATESEKTDADREAEEKARGEAEAKAKAEAEWNALPKIVRDRLQKVDQLDSTMSKLAGHIGGLANGQKRIEEALRSAKSATEKSGGETPSERQITAALADPAAWKQLKEDFPDWAGPVEAEFTALRSELAKVRPVDVDGLRKEINTGIDQRIEQGRTQAIDEAEERAYLRMKYPNWKQTVITPEFKTWFTMQPQEIQALGASNLADDAIKVFDVYAEHQKKVAAAQAERLKKQQRLERAVTPKGAPQPTTTGISDEQAFNRGFSKVMGNRIT